jgi:fido (protein-threonine AMPylation protein)
MSQKYIVDANIYEYDNGVIKNKLNIINQKDLDEAEEKIVAFRLAEFNLQTEIFDLEYLCKIHHHLFADIYE